MKTQSITLMEAYIIENLRKNGIINEEIIAIDDELIKAWQAINDKYNYHSLQKMADQDFESYKLIITEGYKVKFLTLNGLVNLLQLKLNQKRDVDFQVLEDGISDLKITKTEHKIITQMLSANWTIFSGDNESISIRPNI